MGLFDRFESLRQLHGEIKSCGADPFAVRMDKVLSPTEAIIEGRKTILVGTNNYLGLTFDPDCVEAAIHATASEGTGTTGSRVANGSYGAHRQLEEDVADFFGRQHAMVFTTGYQANLGIISTIAGPDDFLVIDADCHASIYDATRLGTATVIRFKHNDPADLDKRLQRIADKPGNKIIICEGIYSMLGDTAPLAEFVEIKRRHGAYLLVDEAHSMGVLGATGRGLAEAAGVEDDVDFIVGTFSKSLGAIGGFCVSNHPELDAVRFATRSYIFTASPSPSVIASTRTALRLLQERPQLRERLWRNAHDLYNGLKALGFRISPQPSPVVAVTVEDRGQSIQWWNRLLESGVYVNLVMPPASPGNYSLLRCSVSAAHTSGQIDRILAAFAALRDSATPG
jgi:8-amino-7-oxononanoate synthase